MKIETFHPEDLEELLLIFNECRQSTSGLPPAAISMQMFKVQIEGENILTIREDAAIAAFISVWEPDNFIHHLYVSPRYQRRGFGQELILATVKRYGRPLRLKCAVANTSARDFYDQSGWIAMGTENGEDGPYINYVLPAAQDQNL